MSASRSFAARPSVRRSATSRPQSTARASARIAASPANLERYLRVVTTGTFTSAAFVVMVVRNLTATVF
jgi:hypothetical protein